jgi:peptide/nickel transport system substrate-binding protein
MIRRLLAFFIVMVIVFSLAACGGSGGSKEPAGTTDGSEEPAQTGDNEGQTDKTNEGSQAKVGGQLIIGNTTELSGDWIPYFQNNAADYDIYNFISGYSTVEVTRDGEFVINKTVVEKDPEITVNEDGSKTYTWTIKDGLTYDDGTPITAKDYVASIMLWSSPVVGEMGAENTYGKYFVGWKEFATGQSKVFRGVRLIDEKTFSVTLAPEHLPYFYELAFVSIGPTKLSFWTDETVDIKDDGEGCYFTDNFTKEAYEERINKARQEIPRPSTGPYVLESYDEASKTAVLKINPKFQGNFEGQKPSIETIIYKKVTSETALDELKTGGVDLLTKMASGDEIQAGLDLVESGGFDYISYPRSGYGKLQFVCDFGPTKYPEVRQAIAYLLDRNEFAKAFTGGFGTVVNGPYGEAMWFYQETKDELNQKLNQYPYSLEKAIEVLEKGGWIYDANGNPYKEGIRYKKTEDGKLIPLIIEWASTENNRVSELLVVRLQQNPDVEKAGMKINQTVMTFSELLNYLYRDATQDPKYGEPKFHMFNLATGFTPLYDLSDRYTTDPELVAQGTNTNFILDEELARLAKEMVKVDPNDKELFKKKFVDFIVRWNELLPDLPLYSNIYHDFFNAKLKNYQNNDLIQLVDAILYAYIEE